MITLNGIYPADNYAIGGNGSEAQPYVSTSGTGGIQEAVNAAAAARGGQIYIPPSCFTLTQPIQITTPAIKLQGAASGFGLGSSALSEGITGSKLKTILNAIQLAPSVATKPQRLGVHDLYLYCVPQAGGTNSTGIQTMATTDTVSLKRLCIENFARGLLLGANDDSLVVEDVAILGCGEAISFVLTTVGIYGKFTFMNVADCTGHGLYTGSGAAPNLTGYVLSDSEFVRCCTTAPADNPANIVWGFYQSVLANTFSGFAGAGANSAWGIIVRGNLNTITGCVLSNNTATGGGGIDIFGNNNVVVGCVFTSNTTDIKIETGATGNIIYCPPGTTITDNGTRTIINDFSTNAGDPASTGQWHGVTVPDGVTIIDTTNGNAYLYYAALTGGRKQL